MQHATPMLFVRPGATLPAGVRAWLNAAAKDAPLVHHADELLAIALRSRPRAVIFDARVDDGEVWSALRRLKADSFTGIVPAAVLVDDSAASFARALDAGADEVLPSSMSDAECEARLALLLRRSDRDVNVHPSTRLPGTVEIEADIARRMTRQETFAVCYADLDHFKEFNDRYSYNDGDGVIQFLSRLLRDVAKGVCGEQGYVGHIGGDDFIFIVPISAVKETCAEIIEVFDLLVPYRYSDADRRAGYFFGKDRRGQLHRVPLMTLSIGVVTNERRIFKTASQVSELATEMKGYAKTLEGSVFTVDRRTDASEEGRDSMPPRLPRVISVIDES
ncbi:MAG: diguanylate cyclase [Gemmatimonadaceae bacterium]